MFLVFQFFLNMSWNRETFPNSLLSPNEYKVDLVLKCEEKCFLF